MSESRKPLHRYLTPDTWPTWIGLGLLRMVCWLPHRAALAVGRGLGRIAERLAGNRRAIVRRNIELCFPEQPDAERRRRLSEHFESLGIGLIEFALAWWGTAAKLAPLATIPAVLLPRGPGGPGSVRRCPAPAAPEPRGLPARRS